MQISKDQVLELLKTQGKDQEAQQAQGELPDQVDTDQHQDLLAKFGINPMELITKFGGGGGGVGKALGGLGG
jgi:hypothetical protein